MKHCNHKGEWQKQTEYEQQKLTADSERFTISDYNTLWHIRFVCFNLADGIEFIPHFYDSDTIKMTTI